MGRLGVGVLLVAGILRAARRFPGGRPREGKGRCFSEEAQKSFADAATLQNNNAFDVAVEEWESS